MLARRVALDAIIAAEDRDVIGPFSKRCRQTKIAPAPRHRPLAPAAPSPTDLEPEALQRSSATTRCAGVRPMHCFALPASVTSMPSCQSNVISRSLLAFWTLTHVFFYLLYELLLISFIKILYRWPTSTCIAPEICTGNFDWSFLPLLSYLLTWLVPQYNLSWKALVKLRPFHRYLTHQNLVMIYFTPQSIIKECYYPTLFMSDNTPINC